MVSSPAFPFEAVLTSNSWKYDATCHELLLWRCPFEAPKRTRQSIMSAAMRPVPMARCKRDADIGTARRGGRDQACSDRTKTASPLHRVSRDISVHVRYGSLADIGSQIRHVRFTPKSGHVQHRHQCPLSANSGLQIAPAPIPPCEECWDLPRSCL